MVCERLKRAIEEHPEIFFDGVGGVGVDTSLGKETCMDSHGIWFEYCPFCGKKIERFYELGKGWRYEEKTEDHRRRI